MLQYPYLERFSSKSVDWYKAKDFCQNQKARLVEIKSKEENEAIADALRENGFSTKKIHFWIGVRDIGNGIHWRVKDQWRLDSNMRKARLKKQQNNLFNSQCKGKVDSIFPFFSFHSHLLLLFVVPFSIFNMNTSLNINF